MVPSALPAFSAPSGVRSLPRRLASAAEILAKAAPAMLKNQSAGTRSRIRACKICFVFMGWDAVPGLERIFQVARDVVAITEEIIATRTEEIHVAEIKSPRVLKG